MAGEDSSTVFIPVHLFGDRCRIRRVIFAEYGDGIHVGNIVQYDVVGVGVSWKRSGRQLSRQLHVGQIDPHFIMFTLLPTFIFESAFALDAQHFQHYMGQILTLAGPAFVTAFAMMGSMMYLLMCLVGEPWWTLGYCMLYGAIVSATDPVAVVALLKSLGVPHHLKVLIEGESLLNDGAAIVFHSLFTRCCRTKWDVATKSNWAWRSACDSSVSH